MFEQLEQNGLGPLDVVDQEDERTFGGEGLDEPANRPGDLLAGKRVVGQTEDRSDMAGDDIAAIRSAHDGLDLVRGRPAPDSPGRIPDAANTSSRTGQ